ncbi:M23 family metallopeptidase [Bacteroides sp. OttesenSCG-928-E20]|nr:M23 family metallopeptidase [Bacteroides sp. OttesenSCG-928-E20]
MLKNLTILVLLICVQVSAQTNSRVKFASPFDFPLYLSGNFGEIRANHFHGGLDFKTQGATGKKVLALANGYISRVRVVHGSGYMLYVNYEGGYTAVHRHDQGFTGELARRIKELQYQQQSWEVELIPQPYEYPVIAGQHISWSGNMGYSFGPHLHLEMQETATGDYIDPLPFFKSRIADTKAPQVLGFTLFPQIGEGVVNNQTLPQVYLPNKKDTLRAWGVIGAGIRAYDYMNGVGNRYGVHTVILEVDGHEVFRSVVDRYSSYEDRMINSWTHGQYMKSFIEPGNTLRMLKAGNNNRGLITIDEERDYHFRYILKDAYGNTTRFSFVVTGKKAIIPPAPARDKSYFAWNKFNYFYKPGIGLIVPRGMLYDDVYLDYEVKTNAEAIAPVHQLTKERVSLHGYSDLRLSLKNLPVPDTTKYYVARVADDGKLVSVGGKYENGLMKARIRELATYTIGLDTVAPKVVPIGKNNWAKSGQIVYKVTEAETGIRSYRGTIDGEYALFYLRIMNNRLICNLDPEYVKRGGKHTVEITVVDNCGNETIVRDNFVW